MTDLDERYGRRRARAAAPAVEPGPDLEGEAEPPRSRRQTRWAAALAAILTLGVVGFWILSQQFGGVATQSVRADTLRFFPDGDRAITIEFHLTAPAGAPLACAIEAQSDRYAVVGWDVIDVPPADGPSQEVSHTLATVGPATTVLVKECWEV